MIVKQGDRSGHSPEDADEGQDRSDAGVLAARIERIGQRVRQGFDDIKLLTLLCPK
jgi:hypothetical protein